MAKYSRRYAALKVRCDRDYISGLDNALGTTCQMQQVDGHQDNDTRDPPHPPSPTSPEIEKGNLVEKRRDDALVALVPKGQVHAGLTGGVEYLQIRSSSHENKNCYG